MGAGHRARGDRGGARRLWARRGRSGACGERGSEADDDASVAHAPLPVNRSNCLGRGLGCCHTICMSYFFATWFSVLLIGPFNASYLEIKVKLLNFDVLQKK